MKIFENFFDPQVYSESTGDLPETLFPATFGGHLEFLHKMQKGIYLGNGMR